MPMHIQANERTNKRTKRLNAANSGGANSANSAIANANSVYANSIIELIMPIGFGETEHAIEIHAYPIHLNKRIKKSEIFLISY
jgi:hypothetical protein